MKGTEVILIGAGGKMGCRLSRELWESGSRMNYVEIIEQVSRNLAELGIACFAGKDIVPESGKAILAVPDVAVGAIKRGIMILFMENWKKIFEPGNVLEQVIDSTRPEF